MKNNFFVIGLLIMTIVLVLVGCSDGQNNDGNGQTYTVTIGTLTNANGCTITASPTSGTEGTEITLTVNEVNSYRLKSGTLKYGTTAINETTKKFTLPAADVTVTAEFELVQSGNNLNGTFWTCPETTETTETGYSTWNSCTLTFTNTEFAMKLESSGTLIDFASGTYELDGTDLTLTDTGGMLLTSEISASLNDDSMAVNAGDTVVVFTKQTNGTNANLEAKSLALTGFTNKSNGDYLVFILAKANDAQENVWAAATKFTLTNGTATIPLKKFSNSAGNIGNDDWKGFGNYYIRIQEWNAGDATSPIITKDTQLINSATTTIAYNAEKWKNAE